MTDNDVRSGIMVQQNQGEKVTDAETKDCSVLSSFL